MKKMVVCGCAAAVFCPPWRLCRSVFSKQYQAQILRKSICIHIAQVVCMHFTSYLDVNLFNKSKWHTRTTHPHKLWVVSRMLCSPIHACLNPNSHLHIRYTRCFSKETQQPARPTNRMLSDKFFLFNQSDVPQCNRNYVRNMRDDKTCVQAKYEDIKNVWECKTAFREIPPHPKKRSTTVHTVSCPCAVSLLLPVPVSVLVVNINTLSVQLSISVIRFLYQC